MPEQTGEQELEFLYKYVLPERTDILSDGLIRFTQASALNDPFESNPICDALREWLIEMVYQRAILPALERLSGSDLVEAEHQLKAGATRTVRQIIEQSRNDYGVLSLSENRSDLLMWSHYAKSHRGFVIGFDVNHPYFRKGMSGKTSPLAQVSYSESRPARTSFDRFAVSDVLTLTVRAN